MAYETGTATGTVDLLDKIKDFATTNGWTVNRYDAAGAGQRLQVTRGGDLFVNLRAYVAETPSNAANQVFYSGSPDTMILFSGSTGYDASKNWFEQPGAYRQTAGQFQYPTCGVRAVAGAIPSFHLFAFNGGDQIYCVVEVVAGRFAWFGFGRVERVGITAGGAFCFSKHGSDATGGSTAINFPFMGSSFAGQGTSRGFVYVSALDGFTGWCPSQVVTNGPAGTPRSADTVQKMRAMWQTTPSKLNSLAPLFPVGVVVTRDGGAFSTDTRFSLIGYLTGLFFMNIKHVTPKDEYTVATDAFRVFSFHEKVDEVFSSFPNNSAGTLGFAIKSN